MFAGNNIHPPVSWIEQRFQFVSIFRAEWRQCLANDLARLADCVLRRLTPFISNILEVICAQFLIALVKVCVPRNLVHEFVNLSSCPVAVEVRGTGTIGKMM